MADLHQTSMAQTHTERHTWSNSIFVCKFLSGWFWWYLAWLSLWKLAALLYICISTVTQSLKACCTVVHMYIYRDSVSESLLHYSTGVYLAWLSLWKLAALLYRCMSPVCGCCAAPDVPDGQTRVGSCSRWLTPVEARTPSGCTCRSVNFSRGPTVPPATSCNDSDDSLKAAWGGYGADGGL